MTGVPLTDIITHPFFLGVNWTDMECGKGKLYTYPPMLKLMTRDRETNQYSPPSAIIGSHTKTRHRILDLDDIFVSILTLAVIVTFLSE